MAFFFFPTGGSTTSSSSSSATVTTVGDLIDGALGELMVRGAGETTAGEDANDALRLFNDFLDGLKAESLGAYQLTRTTWTLTSAASITVGDGGTIDIDRPVSPQAIHAVGYVDQSSGTDVEVLCGQPSTISAYIGIQQKDLEAPFPQRFYYNPTFPLGTLIPYPLPTNDDLLGVIYAPTPISEYAGLSDEISLPPGYRRFLRTNLAIELAPLFGATVSDDLRRNAAESKSTIKRANLRLSDLPNGAAGMFGTGRGYSIYGDC